MTEQLINGDCLEEMKTLINNGVQVDSVVCDPPYHLTSIVKRFGGKNAAPQVGGVEGKHAPFARSSKGFMGKEWDGGDIAFQEDTWKLAYDLLKPGGHLIAFSASRNYHRMAVAIEDAGFEIRDQIMWLYGSGFPKSHNIGKGIDNMEGWGTALKPAHEPIVLARKPLSEKTIVKNVLKHGTGGINIDACRIGFSVNDDPRIHKGYTHTAKAGLEIGSHKDNSSGKEQTLHNSQGRFPANVMHDGSDTIMEEFAKYGGNYARFFYSAKVSKKERGEGNNHPTVKPQELMKYLCRMVTPKGGTVLDPFMGSGSTGMAAKTEKFDFIGIEREKEYFDNATNRINDTEIKASLEEFMK